MKTCKEKNKLTQINKNNDNKKNWSFPQTSAAQEPNNILVLGNFL